MQPTNPPRILILTPDLHALGGVSNHYFGLCQYWTLNIHYSIYGKKEIKANPVLTALRYIPQYFKFLFNLRHADVVIINPSFRKFQLIRDGFFLLSAKIFRKEIITFFHGFDLQLADSLLAWEKLLLSSIYNRSLFIYVLYSGFKEKLRQLGIRCPIFLTTTKVTDSLFHDFNVSRKDGRIKNILFLARIVKDKGIYITINAFSQLKRQYPNLSLTICGDGAELENAKNYVQANGIPNIVFTGSVPAEKVAAYYSTADLYILPTLQEGMATSILEAMTFGLPIISRPVGGINDFFENEKMGELTESLNPDDYALIIEKYLKQPALVKEISTYNHRFAITHFAASQVAKNIEKDIIQHTVKAK